MTFLKHSWIFSWFLVATLVAQEPIDVKIPPTSSPDAESQGYAIVIGVDTYRDSKLDALSYAVKDAEAVSAYLKRQGWTVSLMRSSDTNAATRPDEKAMVLEEIRFVASGTKRKDRLLFYFSGHGFQVGEENYVCVSGTKHEDPATALSQSEILEAFAAGSSAKKAVILDACREAPGGRDVMRGFTRKELDDARGIWHLYSAAPGFKSFEPAAGTKLEGEVVANGFFTHFVLKGLNGAAESNGDGFLTLVELSMYVSGEMRRLSVERAIRRQVPYLLWDGQVDGDFLRGVREPGKGGSVEERPLRPADGIASVESSSLRIDPERERTYWNEIETRARKYREEYFPQPEWAYVELPGTTPSDAFAAAKKDMKLRNSYRLMDAVVLGGYFEDEGVEADAEEVRKTLAAAVRLGNPSALVLQVAFDAIEIPEGESYRVSMYQSVERSASLGEARALLMLAQLYEKPPTGAVLGGRPVRKDLASALLYGLRARFALAKGRFFVTSDLARTELRSQVESQLDALMNRVSRALGIPIPTYPLSE